MGTSLERYPLQIGRTPLIELDSDPRSPSQSSNTTILEHENGRFAPDSNNTIRVAPGELLMDEVLLKSTRAICERYKIQFSQLTTIQRKFVTNFRCSQCGLLPLYHLNLMHVKRVRCKSCGQLMSFKKKGKYGKLRKEIAFEVARRIQGDGKHTS